MKKIKLKKQKKNREKIIAIKTKNSRALTRTLPVCPWSNIIFRQNIGFELKHLFFRMSDKSRRVSNERVYKEIFGETVAAEFSDSESEAETESHKEFVTELIEKTEPVSPNAPKIDDQNTSPTDDKGPDYSNETTETADKSSQPSDPANISTGESPSVTVSETAKKSLSDQDPANTETAKLPDHDPADTSETGTSPSSVRANSPEIAESAEASSSPPQSRPIEPATIIKEPNSIEKLPANDPETAFILEPVTNIPEKYSVENDVRNKMQFSATIVSNTSFFEFQIRKDDKDLGDSLVCKISRIPLLTSYVKRTIEDFKRNYTRGDVSFKTRFFFKYSIYI